MSDDGSADDDGLQLQPGFWLLVLYCLFCAFLGRLWWSCARS